LVEVGDLLEPGDLVEVGVLVEVGDLVSLPDLAVGDLVSPVLLPPDLPDLESQISLGLMHLSSSVELVLVLPDLLVLLLTVPWRSLISSLRSFLRFPEETSDVYSSVPGTARPRLPVPPSVLLLLLVLLPPPDLPDLLVVLHSFKASSSYWDTMTLLDFALDAMLELLFLLRCVRPTERPITSADTARPATPILRCFLFNATIVE